MPFKTMMIEGQRERRHGMGDVKFERFGVQKFTAVSVEVKFIIFPICPMNTYAHHASV